MQIITQIACLLSLAVLMAFLPAGAGHASQKGSGSAAASVPVIKVFFKLDPRITRGMYMGDRWVSPPAFTAVQSGKEITVDARIEGIDPTGKLNGSIPAWKTEDPEMLRVSPDKGRQVTITVRRAGESALTVTCGKVARKLAVKATSRGDAIQVEISQREVANAEGNAGQ